MALSPSRRRWRAASFWAAFFCARGRGWGRLSDPPLAPSLAVSVGGTALAGPVTRNAPTTSELAASRLWTRRRRARTACVTWTVLVSLGTPPGDSVGPFDQVRLTGTGTVNAPRSPLVIT